ncbi:MAG: tyrosine-type recombinase/integrase [Candidatus Omnitrophica bacterium]|nr:tyrosine-type recombinase/integrase [Candidatus Omnitrophota bacterium]
MSDQRSLTNGRIQIGGYEVTKRKRDFRVVGTAPEKRGLVFSVSEVRPGKWRASRTISTGERVRRQVSANDAGEAIQQAEAVLLGRAPMVVRDPMDLTVADVFAEWYGVLQCNDKTQADYRRAVKKFLRWVETEGVWRWESLRPSHFQRYCNEMVQAGLRYNSVRLRMFPILSAARWAAKEFPEFRNLAEPFKMPRFPEQTMYKEPVEALTVADIGDFVLWLREQRLGWNVLPGVVLQGLCGLRVSEVSRLKWSDIDFESGTVTIEGEIKNRASCRRIPLPVLAVDVLRESTRIGSLVIAAYSGDHREGNYGKAVRAYLKAWRPGLEVIAGDLRDVIQTTGELEGWQGYVLDKYVGHAGNSIRRKHYVKPRAEELLRLMREQVSGRVDFLTADHREKWVGASVRVLHLVS